MSQKREYEFHKWKKQLLVADNMIIVLFVLLLALSRPDYVVIAAYLFIIPYLILTQRKTLFYHLMVASGIAIIWVLIAKDEYSYARDFLILNGINLYPLFAWAGGLLAMYIIYSHYEHFFHEKGFVRKLLLFTAFYWLMLIAVETVAYHIFNIRNIAATTHAGLPICNCMHAPTWMKIAYFAMGPVFFTICYLLKLENPHVKKILRKMPSLT